MAKRPLSETRMAIREEAIQTLKKWGDDPEVCRQVEALIGSLGDTLEDKVVLEEMRALKKSGTPFREIFADVRNAKLVGERNAPGLVRPREA
jgi:hypothetical protein